MTGRPCLRSSPTCNVEGKIFVGHRLQTLFQWQANGPHEVRVLDGLPQAHQSNVVQLLAFTGIVRRMYNDVVDLDVDMGRGAILLAGDLHLAVRVCAAIPLAQAHRRQPPVAGQRALADAVRSRHDVIR